MRGRVMLGAPMLGALILLGCPQEDERSAQDEALEQLEGYQARLEEMQTRLEKTQRKLEEAQQSKVEPGDMTIAELAQEAVSGNEIEDVAVVVLDAHEIQLNGETVTAQQLEDKLTAAANDGVARLILRAGPDVPHKRVTEVLDRAKRAGMHKLAIASVVDEPAAEPTDPEDG